MLVNTKYLELRQKQPGSSINNSPQIHNMATASNLPLKAGRKKVNVDIAKLLLQVVVHG